MLAEELQKIAMNDTALVLQQVRWNIPGIGTAIPDLRTVADMCIAHNLKETGQATVASEASREGLVASIHELDEEKPKHNGNCVEPDWSI
jgi:hypothetical protein